MRERGGAAHNDAILSGAAAARSGTRVHMSLRMLRNDKREKMRPDFKEMLRRGDFSTPTSVNTQL